MKATVVIVNGNVSIEIADQVVSAAASIGMALARQDAPTESRAMIALGILAGARFLAADVAAVLSELGIDEANQQRMLEVITGQMQVTKMRAAERVRAEGSAH